MSWQDNVARNDKTHGPAEEDIAGKMIANADTGEAMTIRTFDKERPRQGHAPSLAGRYIVPTRCGRTLGAISLAGDVSYSLVLSPSGRG